jgi:Protein of unknown function (DUF4089)
MPGLVTAGPHQNKLLSFREKTRDPATTNRHFNERPIEDRKKSTMAKTRKSRTKTKAAPAARASKMRARKTPPFGQRGSRKVAPKPKSVASPLSDPLDGFIEAAARMLALPIEPPWLAAIKANLEVNLRLAAFVAEFSLPDETEPAPVFTP